MYTDVFEVAYGNTKEVIGCAVSGSESVYRAMKLESTVSTSLKTPFVSLSTSIDPAVDGSMTKISETALAYSCPAANWTFTFAAAGDPLAENAFSVIFAAVEPVLTTCSVADAPSCGESQLRRASESPVTDCTARPAAQRLVHWYPETAIG